MIFRPWGRFVVAIVYVWLLDLMLRHGMDHQGATSNELRFEALPGLRDFIKNRMSP